MPCCTSKWHIPCLNTKEHFWQKNSLVSRAVREPWDLNWLHWSCGYDIRPLKLMVETLIARILCFLMDLWVLHRTHSTNSSALVLPLTPSLFFLFRADIVLDKWSLQKVEDCTFQSLMGKVQRMARSCSDSSHLFIDVLQRCLDALGTVVTQLDTKSRSCPQSISWHLAE